MCCLRELEGTKLRSISFIWRMGGTEAYTGCRACWGCQGHGQILPHALSTFLPGSHSFLLKWGRYGRKQTRGLSSSG